VPKLRCPCGFIHNLSPIPDDGWLTIRDRDHDELLPADTEPQPTGAEIVTRVIHLAGRMYECPQCGRLMWSLPGDRCTTFRVYRPEE
jgi:hypothetical protein